MSSVQVLITLLTTPRIRTLTTSVTVVTLLKSTMSESLVFQVSPTTTGSTSGYFSTSIPLPNEDLRVCRRDNGRYDCPNRKRLKDSPESDVVNYSETQPVWCLPMLLDLYLCPNKVRISTLTLEIWTEVSVPVGTEGPSMSHSSGRESDVNSSLL